MIRRTWSGGLGQEGLFRKVWSGGCVHDSCGTSSKILIY